MSREFLEKQAAAKEEVGPPYTYATITPAGFQAVEIKGEDVGGGQGAGLLPSPHTPLPTL